MADAGGVRAGRIYWDHGLDRSQITEFLNEVKRVGKEAKKALDDAGAGEALDGMGKAARRSGKELSQTQKRIKEYRDRVLSLRNEIDLGVISQDDGIKKLRETQQQIRKTMGTTERYSNEYRNLSTQARRTESDLAQLEGRTTKLGFSARVSTGVTQSLSGQLQRLGPAGDAAALGLRAMTSAGSIFAPMFGNKIPLALQSTLGLLSKIQLLAPIALGAGLFGFSRLADRAAELANEIDKGAQRAGVSAEAYQELGFAFRQAGVEQSDFLDITAELNQVIGEAVRGEQRFVEQFGRLGVTLRDGVGDIRDTEDVLLDTLRALEAIPEPSRRAGEAVEIFGDDVGRKLLPVLNLGVDSIEELREQARELGLVLSGDAILSLVAYRDEMATLRQQFQTAGVEIIASFIPVMRDYLIPLLQNTVVPWLQNVAEATGTLAARFFDAGEEGVVFRGQIADLLIPVITLGQYLTSLGELAVGLTIALTSPFATLGSILGTLSVQFDEFLDVYRRALQGDFSGFLKSPAEILFPSDSIANAIDAGVRQAQEGGQILRGGWNRFVSAFDTSTLRESIIDSLSQGVGAALDGTVRTLDFTSTEGAGAAGTVRTPTQIFEELEAAGTRAERKAAAFGSTLAARMESVETRAGLVRGAIDQLFEAGLDSMDARVQYLIGRLEDLDRQARILGRDHSIRGLAGRLQGGDTAVGAVPGVPTALTADSATLQRAQGLRRLANLAVIQANRFWAGLASNYETLIETQEEADRRQRREAQQRATNARTLVDRVVGAAGRFWEGVGENYEGVLEEQAQAERDAAREREQARAGLRQLRGTVTVAGATIWEQVVANYRAIIDEQEQTRLAIIRENLRQRARILELRRDFTNSLTEFWWGVQANWQAAIDALTPGQEAFNARAGQLSLDLTRRRRRGSGGLEGFRAAELTAEQEARREVIEQLTTVGATDGPLAALGKSALSVATEKLPVLGSALQGFVTAGPIGAISAVFADLLASAQPVVDLFEIVGKVFGKFSEIVGEIIAPVLQFVGKVLTGIANVFVSIYNFVLGWIFGRVDPIRPEAKEATEPEGGAFGPNIPNSQPPTISLSSPAASAQAGVPTLWLDSITMFAGSVGEFRMGVGEFREAIRTIRAGPRSAGKAARYAG